MALFSFDDRYTLFGATPVDNQFIFNEVPTAPGDAVRVYLYGLTSATNPKAIDSLEQMARELHMSEKEVEAAFRYWERRGLVQRISDNPKIYRYLSANQVALFGGKPQTDPAYEAFAEALYGLFDNERQIHGKEITRCYEWVEQMGLPAEVVIAMVKFLISSKGKNFSIKAAETLAVSLADAKITTVEAAEAFFQRDKRVYLGCKDLLNWMGVYRNPTTREQDYYATWIYQWGFTSEGIIEALEKTDATLNPSFKYINGILTRIHDSRSGGANSGKQVAEFFRGEEEEIAPLKALLNVMRLPNLTINEGTKAMYQEFRALYPDPIILMAARECAKRGKDFAAIKQTLQVWKNEGLETVDQISQVIQEINDLDALLVTLYAAIGLDAKPSPADRKILKKWMEQYRFDVTFLLVCAPWAAGTKVPMRYLDKMFTDFNIRGIRTLAEAEKEHQNHTASSSAAPDAKAGKIVGEQQYTQREYTHSEDSIDEMMKQWQEAGNAQ